MTTEAQMREQFEKAMRSSDSNTLDFRRFTTDSGSWCYRRSQTEMLYNGFKLALSSLPRMTRLEIATLINNKYVGVNGAWEATDALIAKLPHIVKERCAVADEKLLDPNMPAQELRLHMGELTTDELSVARAAIQWANTRIDPTNVNAPAASPLSKADDPWNLHGIAASGHKHLDALVTAANYEREIRGIHVIGVREAISELRSLSVMLMEYYQAAEYYLEGIAKLQKSIPLRDMDERSSRFELARSSLSLLTNNAKE